MLIAQSTGKPASSPKNGFDVTAGPEVRREYLSHYAGTACPLLKDRLCSIYAHRPLACRVHHSLEGSPSACDDGGQPQSVDLAEIFLSQLRMMGPR